VANVREAEEWQAQGLTIPKLRKRLQVGNQTFYRWRPTAKLIAADFV
jgi:transposase